MTLVKEKRKVRKIVVEESDDGAWVATFRGGGPFTPKDMKRVKRRLEISYRTYRHSIKVVRAAAKMRSEKDA